MAPRMERSASRFWGRGRSSVAEADIEIVCYSPFLRFITFWPSPRKRSMVFAISVELVAKDYGHCEGESAARQSGCCAKSCGTVQNGEKNILRDPVWHDNARKISARRGGSMK